MPRTVRAFVRIVAPLAAIVLIGQGCVSVKRGAAGADGGLYRSINRGEEWTHPVALPGPKAVGTISGVDVATMAFDPGDPKAIYIGTAASGMFYSYDGAQSWQRPGAVPNARVPAIAVSQRNKCVIFLAFGNRVVRSLDCNRTYQIVYTDARSDVLVSSLVIDWFRPLTVYATTNKGDLLRSEDEGQTWAPVRRFEDEIVKMVMSAKDSRHLIVGLRQRGIQRSLDGGETWTEIRKQFDGLEGAKKFFDLSEVRTENNTYILASRFGLLRTADNGDSWQKIETLTPPGSTIIYALATNPQNGREIYYTTANTLYRSLDGGLTWTPKKLPTSRAGTAVAVDPNDGNVIYLGGTTLKK